MPEITIDHLLDRASRTVAGPGRPRQADLRRGVSDAYYAMFHAMTAAVAAQALRNVPVDVASSYRRSLRHGGLRQISEQLAEGQSLPSPQALSIAAVRDTNVRLVAQSFVHLQEERHLADYSHDEVFDLVRLNDAIANAKRGINVVRSQAQTPGMASFLSLIGMGSSWAGG